MLRTLFVAMMGLAATAATASEPVDLRAITSARRVFDRNYVLGQEAAVYVGQPIVKVKDYHVIETVSGTVFKADVAFRYKMRMFGPDLSVPEGSSLRYVRTQQHDGREYTVVAIPGQELGVTLLLDGADTFTGLVSNVLQKVYSVSGNRPLVMIEPRPIHFTRGHDERIDTQGGYVNFELVYSGRTKDAINLLYREFTPDDMARPAFSQVLTYDPGSTTLRFRDVVVRVIDASNEGIRYVVDADGLPPG
jgi:hypothetical protein